VSDQVNNSELIEGGQSHCNTCSAPLCLRKQVINLALGNIDEMFCLICSGADSGRSAEDVLTGIKDYVLSRPCFKKEWVKYPNVTFCPEPHRCFPETCFAAGDLDEVEQK